MASRQVREVLVGVVLVATGQETWPACGDRSANRMCQRPLIVLKTARSGSSFLGDQLDAKPWTCFREEVTNWIPNHKNCTEQLEIMDHLMSCTREEGGLWFSGFTHNPFKWGDAGEKCKDVLAALVRRHNAAVAVLERDNVVAQAISFLIGHEITAKRLLGDRVNEPGCDPWHLYRCSDLPPEIAHHKIKPNPIDLLSRVRHTENMTKELKRFALDVAGGYYSIHFEQIIQFTSTNLSVGHGAFSLAQWASACIICGCDCEELPDPPFGSTVTLSDKLVNYDKVRSTFDERAPDLSRWFDI